MARRTIIILAAIFALACGTALADNGSLVFPFKGAVHAEGTLTYTDGSSKTWDWDRGRISALSSDSISLTRRDKQVVTFAITSSTVVRNDGGSYSLSDLKVGLAATVISQNGDALIIRNIRGDGAPSGADQSALEGPAAKSVTGTVDAEYADGSSQSFEYDRGRITQLGDGSLTIARPDKQTVTLTFDASTLPVWQKGKVVGAAALAQGDGGTFFSQDGKLAVVHGLVVPKGR
jgi:hypothetical protein